MGYEERVPKYLAIYGSLAAAIKVGDYPPGEALPPQRELAERYGVTLMTVRQALRALQEDGLVEARPGTGTFVRQSGFDYHLSGLRSLAEELTAQGLELRTRVLSSNAAEPSEEIRAWLDLTEGERVIGVERLRSTGEPPSPVLLQTSYLPERLTLRLDVDQLDEVSLYRMLAEDLGRPVTSARERLRAVALSAREAKLLGRREGEPALLSLRISKDAEGKVLLVDRAVLPEGAEVVADRSSDVRLSYQTER
ncbi:GntR family transcriptional regulator [Crossiella equi]|uniref:GntR family transcriptional regulator n=1 Tax=Crossiella equi TaxID=130796 RepID=A0ABS5A677_9PSEU|nr:GntR family transcriptional regulator [Crossiella equi]MBP2472095.1 GntR family transcriptional regulator [Crossiella equi]